MNIGLYARVSTERQQERGTVTSQLELLRAAAETDGHEIVEEFVDDGLLRRAVGPPRTRSPA